MHETPPKTNHTQSLSNYPGQNILLKARPTTLTLKSARSLSNPAPQKRLGRVEEGRGGLYRIGITPFPFPAHQTGRANFPHPAFRLASSRGTRRGAKMNPAQPKHAEIPEHGPSREPRGAARRHLVTPDQKMPHALIDVIVDRSIGRQARPVAEVVRPAAQHAVQLVAHLGPGCLGCRAAGALGPSA